MGGAFFNSWALWQKMTFVLAAAIVATLGIGACKVVYDRWRLNKYTEIEKKKGKVVPMSEAAVVDQDQIPFGIRALERGIEVEGIYISRTNTPAPSRPQSRSSSMWNLSDLESAKGQPITSADIERLQQQIRERNDASSVPSSRAPSGVFDRSSFYQSSEQSSPNTSTYGFENVSHAEASGKQKSKLRHSAPSAALEGSGPSTLDVHPFNDPSSSSSDKRSTSSTESERERSNADHRISLPTSRNQALPPKRVINPLDRVSLDLLQSHRLSHVAETGQLTPRVRRPGHSGEWASVAGPASEHGKNIPVDYFHPSRREPSPPRVPPSPELSATTENPFVTPAITPSAVPATPSRLSEVPLSPPEQQMPLLQSYQPSHLNEDELELAQPERAFRNSARQSQILRKVNSGFEILHPGSFPAPQTAQYDVDLEAGEGRLSGERRRSARLQKRRPSDARKTSNFKENLNQGS